MKDSKWIYFDMDGTLNRFYEVEGWLDMLIASDPTPYKLAAPLVNMNTLARKLNKLQRKGYKIGIISWLSKSSTPEYDEAVTAAKLWWLHKHLNSVNWDAINIVSYGRDKWEICGEGILFDDEALNRDNWGGEAYHPDMIMEILSSLMA
jgi:FMN phosphatase YigB (HAD superfamily)